MKINNKLQKIPMRRCIGCHTMKSKCELLKIVKNKENQVALDLEKKKDGRGAYICKSLECFEKIKKYRKIEKAFKINVNNEFYNLLGEQFGGV